jgi:hypothetical protein
MTRILIMQMYKIFALFRLLLPLQTINDIKKM